MTFLTELWLPILLSAVFVFIVSSVIHMALPIHKGDCRKMSNEDAVLESMRKNGIEPGAYMFPCAASMKDMGSPEMVEKLKKGPVGWLTVLPPGGLNIGRSLACWFVFCLIVGVLAAYVGWHTLGAGAAYRAVFRITGAAAVLGYAIGHLQDSIWKGAKWGTTAKFIFDGIVYALVTAGTFGWLWPHAQ
ncbi:MAG: hypothetical protein HZB38_12855 [Planctomycetes bacterium]|nr:hypothetical protein [Planctomycetota bacterium]